TDDCSRPTTCTTAGWTISTGTPSWSRKTTTSGSFSPMPSPRPAVFLDRDGVLNVDHGYVHRPEQVEWGPGAIGSVRRLNGLGYRVVVVTNQAGVAHGHYGEDSVFALHAWMRDALAAHGAVVDAFYHCPYHPEGRVEQFRRSHIDRKPGPGMILRAF